MSNLAIIPARGGSKRIPRKNIKFFLGKPIIAYSIEAAIRSELFDEVMVSTDDEEIAEIAGSYGAKVPFLRSFENASDFSTTVEVIFEVLNCYKKQQIQFENGCCIYPTAPLINADRLKQGSELLEKGKFNTVFPVVEFSYPIWRSLKLRGNEKAEMFWPENLNKRSQDLEPAYHDAGQFYWFNCNTIAKEQNLFNGNSAVIRLNEMEVQDIDTMNDWRLAEMKYKILNEV
ncbi:MAG: pseudaminic acid cytidylyltransferase [Daejeonella sp.]